MTLKTLIMIIGLMAFASPALANEGGHGGGGAEAHGGGEPPPGEGKPEKKKPKAPKPKRPDKDKNCGWDRDVDMDIDGKHLKLNQAALKNVMKGAESEQDGYDIFADPDRLTLKVKTPEGGWFIASMTRLGDMNEGCVFYFVGEAKQVTEEPPLF